jgi:hypothetical protein
VATPAKLGRTVTFARTPSGRNEDITVHMVRRQRFHSYDTVLAHTIERCRWCGKRMYGCVRIRSRI